jgi:hypothetical protein
MLENPTDLPNLPERYEVRGEADATPFERTLHAHDRVLRRDVLLKLPAAQAFASWSVPVRDRLLREARALASVRHEAVLPILNVEETAAGPVLVLEEPDGELLASRLQLGPLEVEAARQVAIDVAEGLGALHYASFVHRAVGPEAVWVRTDGRARLGAFTFAKEFGGHGGSSIDYRGAVDGAALRPGTTIEYQGVGSRTTRFLPAYPAPEQLQGQPADPRCDVFALGCLLYRCLSGQEPSGAESGEATELRLLRPEVPKDLAEVVRRCMAFARAARYPTAQALADALKATRLVATNGSGGSSHRWALVAALGSCAVLAVGGLYAWFRPPVDVPGRSPVGNRIDYERTFADTYERCHALLIGIDDYSGEWADLPNTVKDVAEVGKRLQANDERWAKNLRVVPAAQATQDQIIDELDLLRDPQRVGAEDAVLVYFAGHGHYVDSDSEQYWLVAADARTKEPRKKEGGFVHSDNILDFLRMCPAKHVLVVLDTCFGARVFGPSRGEVLRDSPKPAAGPRDPRLRRASRQILVSAGKRATATDGAGEVSPFCRAFVAAITPGDGKPRAVSSRAVWQSTEEAMREHGGGLQMPEMKELTAQDGCFVFFVPAKE